MNFDIYLKGFRYITYINFRYIYDRTIPTILSRADMGWSTYRIIYLHFFSHKTRVKKIKKQEGIILHV